MLQADKSTIVGEAVTYIKSLEGTVQRLEKLKQERMLAQQAAVGAGSSSGAASSSAPPPPPPPPPAQAVAATRESVLADMVQRWNAQEALVAELKAAATAVVYGAGTASDGAAPAPQPTLARAELARAGWKLVSVVPRPADRNDTVEVYRRAAAP